MCDCVMPDVYGEKKRKARKEHKCCECGRTIFKGEHYQYIHGIWEGNPQDYKTCKWCVKIRNVATKYINDLHQGDCGPCFTMLFETLQEMHYECIR